jgi:hypothetical protein
VPVKIWKFGGKFPDCEYSSAGYVGVHEPPVQTAGRVVCTNWEGYSHELFAVFRRFEAKGYTCIIAELPEENSGISEGLRDRIIRAAVD